MSNTATPAAAPAQETQQAAQQLLFQLGTGYIASSALYIATKLTIADKLAKGPRTAASLAARRRMSRRTRSTACLRTLASLGVFEETEPRNLRAEPRPLNCFALTGRDRSTRWPLWLTEPFHFRVYAELMYSVKTGKPAGKRSLGMPVFEYSPAKQPELSRVFNNAMTAFSARLARRAEAYDFSGIDTLVDVAGGHGEVLTSILQKYPQMRGVLFDLEHVIAGARPRIDRSACRPLPHRVRRLLQGGARGGDAYIMKHIIHDWDDERALTILENIRTAMNAWRPGDPARIACSPGTSPISASSSISRCC